MKILFVEDDEDISRLAKTMFMNNSHDVILCPSPECAISTLGLAEFDLVILDMTFSDGCGDEVLAHIADKKLKVPVVIHTGFLNKYKSVLNYYTNTGIIRKVYEKPSKIFHDMLNNINSFG